MKKTLFFILAVAFCASLAAQPNAYTGKDFKHVAKKTYKTVHGGSNEPTANFTPSQRISPLLSRGDGGELSEIGGTYHIMQTNSTARNTINWAPDGSTCAATWIFGDDKGVRGTGLNYLDYASGTWEPIPEVRVEQGTSATVGNPGWGAHVFTEEGECVLAHSVAADVTGGIVINYREKRGEGEWQQSVLKGPLSLNNKTVILWPTVCAVGNTIHMVCVTDNESTFEGFTCNPLYFRSTDGGLTWEDYKTFNTMPLDEKGKFRGDDYVLTARGNHVVLVYGEGHVSYMESFDGGNTWEYHQVYEALWDWEETGKWFGPLMCATSIAATIGDDDKLHVAFGAEMRLRSPDNAPLYYGSYPFLAGMYTWSAGDPVITQEDMDIEFDFDKEEFLSYGFYLLPNYLDAPDLLGYEYFIFSPESDLNTFPDNYSKIGYIGHPRLLAKDNKVYLLYSSIIEQPMVSIQGGSVFFRGVFLTVSYDNGKTFDQNNNTSWLSYHPDLFWIDDWEGYEPNGDPENPYIPNPFVYPASENGFPSMCTNIENNTLVFTWLNNILIPFTDDQWSDKPASIFALTLPISQAGIYSNTQQIWKGYWNVAEKEIIDNLKVYPNPAANLATIEVGTNNPYTLTVTNIMGQVVQTIKGQKSKVELNVSNYPAGIYIINVRTAHATVSQKLIVK